MKALETLEQWHLCHQSGPHAFFHSRNQESAQQDFEIEWPNITGCAGGEACRISLSVEPCPEDWSLLWNNILVNATLQTPDQTNSHRDNEKGRYSSSRPAIVVCETLPSTQLTSSQWLLNLLMLHWWPENDPDSQYGEKMDLEEK